MSVKLMVIGSLDLGAATHAEITEILQTSHVQDVDLRNVELCLVDEVWMQTLYDMPEACDKVIALYGTGKDPDVVISALEHGVAGYLRLPPVPEETAHLLSRMVQPAKTQARMHMYRELAEEAFWMGLITRKISDDPESIAEAAARFDISIQGVIQPLFIRYRHRKLLQNEGKELPDADVEEQIRSGLRNVYFTAFPNVQMLTVAPHKLIVLVFTENVEKPYDKIKVGCKAFLRDCPSLGIDSLCLMGDPAEESNLADRVKQLFRIGNDQVYLDNQFLPSRQKKQKLEHPPQPNVEKYLALLDAGMFDTAYEELRTYLYTPSVMPKVNNSFLTNFHHQLLDGLRELRVSRKSGVNIMQNISEDIANSATDSVQDFLVYFMALITKLKEFTGMDNHHRNVVEEVKIYILDHLSEELSRERIAQRFYLSADYLDRLFRRAYEQTLTEFVLQARIDLAKQLLCNEDLLISVVAYKAGFINASQFSRTFKKATGLSPNAYRKQITYPALHQV